MHYNKIFRKRPQREARSAAAADSISQFISCLNSYTR
jgi:hypothetical protein